MLTEKQCQDYSQIATEIQEFVEKYRRINELSPILISSLIQDTNHWIEELKRLSSEQIQEGIYNGFSDEDY